ncbi:hypothetical protein P3L10_002469 [Capsicum annuum]
MSSSPIAFFFVCLSLAIILILISSRVAAIPNFMGDLAEGFHAAKKGVTEDTVEVVKGAAELIDK